MSRLRLTIALTAVAALAAACTDGSSRTPTAPDAASVASAAKGGVAADRVTAAALWNLRTRAIIGRRGGNSNAAAR